MRDLVLLLFVVGTLPMALVRPIIGLLLWMMFSYLNPHRLTWGITESLPWVMVVALVTFVGLAAQPKQRRFPPMKPTIVLMTLFLIWAVISTSQAALPGLAFGRLDAFVKMIIMAYVTAMLVTDREKLQWVVLVIVASFGFWGAKGGLFTLLTGGSYHVMGPPSSFFRDNNQFAMIMCMILPLMRYVQLYTERYWMRNALWVVMGLTTVSIIGTYSRGGFLALGVVGLMLILKSRRRMGLLMVAPLLVVAIVALMPQQYFARIHTINDNQLDTSASGRIDSWKFAASVAEAHPFVGGGFEVWASDNMWNTYGPPGALHRAIHSIFFEVLGEQGFVGLGLFLLLIASGYIGLGRVKKQARAGPELQWLGDLAGMLQVSLVGFVAAGSLLPMPYIDIFYQMLALVAVMQVMMARLVAEPGRSTAHPGVTRRAAAPQSTSVRSDSRPAHSQPDSVRETTRSIRPGGTQDLPPW